MPQCELRERVNAGPWDHTAVGLFESLPIEPRPASQPPAVRSWPSWSQRPAGVLGAFVALPRRAVATSEAVLVADRFIAYPEGFEFTLSVWAPNDRAALPPFPHWHRDRRTPEVPPGILRIGVVFADGRATTNLGILAGDTVPGDGPVLDLVDEDGYKPHWEVRHWVGPLPPPGAVTLVVEWPAQGIVETAMAFDGDAIREAAASADVVWA